MFIWLTVQCSDPGGGCCVCVNSACTYGLMCSVLTQVEVVVFVSTVRVHMAYCAVF